MKHLSVSPTNGNGPTQGQRKTLTRVGIKPMVRSPLLYRLSYEVRQEQAVETEDVKVTAINMYKYEKGVSFYISRANAHTVHMGYKTSTSHYTIIS